MLIYRLIVGLAVRFSTRTVRAPLLAIAVCVPLGLLFSGCGQTDIEDAGNALRALAKSTSEKAIEAASKKLEKLEEDGAIEKQLGAAACNGLTSFANTGELPDSDGWKSFLVSQVEATTIGMSVNEIEDKVSEFEAASHIAEVTNPSVASQYLRACSFPHD